MLSAATSSSFRVPTCQPDLTTLELGTTTIGNLHMQVLPPPSSFTTRWHPHLFDDSISLCTTRMQLAGAISVRPPLTANAGAWWKQPCFSPMLWYSWARRPWSLHTAGRWLSLAPPQAAQRSRRTAGLGGSAWSWRSCATSPTPCARPASRRPECSLGVSPGSATPINLPRGSGERRRKEDHHDGATVARLRMRSRGASSIACASQVRCCRRRSRPPEHCRNAPLAVSRRRSRSATIPNWRSAPRTASKSKPTNQLVDTEDRREGISRSTRSASRTSRANRHEDPDPLMIKSATDNDQDIREAVLRCARRFRRYPHGVDEACANPKRLSAPICPPACVPSSTRSRPIELASRLERQFRRQRLDLRTHCLLGDTHVV